MNILVTGATGFIGNHVVARLLSNGHSVTAVARNGDVAKTFPWYETVDFIACDIHATGDLFARSGRPDAVIHLAWPGLPHFNELFHFERNLFDDCRFLKTLIRDGAKQLLIAGTCLEYGLQSGCLREDVETKPVTPYGLAKDTLRKYVMELASRFDIAAQWARLFYMYGPGQNPNSLLAQLDRSIDAGEPVFNMSLGAQERDYLPVEAVAEMLVVLVEHPECTGIVNVCSGRAETVRSLVERHVVKRGANVRLNLGHFPYPEYEPMVFWGDRSRFDACCKAGPNRE